MFETQLLKPFTDITLRSLSLSPLEDMLRVGGADDMHGLLLQLSLDKTLFPEANKQSVFWLAKSTFEKSTMSLGPGNHGWTPVVLSRLVSPARCC